MFVRTDELPLMLLFLGGKYWGALLNVNHIFTLDSCVCLTM